MRGFELVRYRWIVVGTSYNRCSGYAKETERNKQIPLDSPGDSTL